MSTMSPYIVSIHWNVSLSPGGPTAKSHGARAVRRLRHRDVTRSRSQRDASELAVDDSESTLAVDRERRFAPNGAQRDRLSRRDRPRQSARIRLVDVHSVELGDAARDPAGVVMKQ